MSTKDLPASRSAGIAFTYNDHAVLFDENRFIDVTQMWRAVGSPANKEFRAWKRKDGASFIRDLAKSLNVPQGHVFQSSRGRTGRTWAHWQVAVAYAKYLSNEFHRFVNEAFREWAQEKADPDLKVKRAIEGYRHRGWDDRKIRARIEGIVQRNSFTAVLQEHGVVERGYAVCTDAINKEVLGGSAKEAKLSMGLGSKARVRDHLEPHQLAALQFAEAMASKRIEDSCSHGNGPCCNVCEQAGSVVRHAMNTMGLVAKIA